MIIGTRTDKQTNGTQESKSRSSHIWTQLWTFLYISPNEYEKKTFLVMKKKDGLFNKQCRVNWTYIWKKLKSDSYLYSGVKKNSGGLKNHMWQNKAARTMHLLHYITNATSLAQSIHRLLCSKNNYGKKYKNGSSYRTVVFKLFDNNMQIYLNQHTHTPLDI